MSLIHIITSMGPSAEGTGRKGTSYLGPHKLIFLISFYINIYISRTIWPENGPLTNLQFGFQILEDIHCPVIGNRTFVLEIILHIFPLVNLNEFALPTSLLERLRVVQVGVHFTLKSILGRGESDIARVGIWLHLQLISSWSSCKLNHNRESNFIILD